MVFFKKKYVLLFITILLFLFIMHLINYLVINDYIVETFQSLILSQDNPNNSTHSVNLPLTTTYSCKNFCGPNARCAITGQQCFTDIDCPGCQPYVPPLSNTDSECIPGDNDAGKLTWGVTPQYSTLTTDIGTKATLITNKPFAKPAMANYGVNTWKSSFVEGEKLFDKRYQPNNLLYTPNYDKRYSLTGEFIENGPLAANAYLTVPHI